MSLDPSHSNDAEDPLESTRRLVRQLEIDAHLMRADLTRLEVELLDDTNGRPIAPIVRQPSSAPRITPHIDHHDEVAAATAPAVLAKHDPTPSQSAAPTPTAPPSWQPAAAALPELMDISIGVADDPVLPNDFADAPESADSTPDFIPVADDASHVTFAMHANVYGTTHPSSPSTDPPCPSQAGWA